MEEEVILMHPTPPLFDNKSSTISSNDNKPTNLEPEVHYIQLMEEVNYLIIFLKWFKAPAQVIRFIPPVGYHTINKNGKNGSQYWNWIIKRLLKFKQNSETVW